MEDDRKHAVAEIKAKVERDEYTVDPVAVADALLKRLRELSERRREHVRTGERGPPRPDERGPRYNACSYPASSPPGQSAKRRPGWPANTWPIQVSWTASSWSRNAASALARAFRGTQAQSS